VKEITAFVSEGKAKEVAELTIEQCNEVVYQIIADATGSVDVADECKLHFGSSTERKEIKAILSTYRKDLDDSIDSEEMREPEEEKVPVEA